MSDKIPTYIKKGWHDRDWYMSTQKMLIELYGSEAGIVAQVLAATSINTSLKANVTLFRKAFHELKNDLPFSNYLPNIKLQLERLRDGRELSGRKIRNFAAAMSGDVNAVVVDIWLLRAFDQDKKYYRGNQLRSAGATDKQYTNIQNEVNELAATHRLTPRQMSAVIWSGVREYTTGDKLTTYDYLLRQKQFSMFD